MPTTEPVLEAPKPLDRKTQRIFAGSVPPEDNIAIFGSLAAPVAPPKDDNDNLPENKDSGPAEGGDSDENASAQEIFSDDPDKIQNDAYKKGWAAAVVSDDSPALEDMNALFYLITRQLAYLYEKGIPEWDPGTVYHGGSICLHPNSKKIYISIKEGTNQTEPGSDENAWFELGSDKATIKSLKDATRELHERIDSAELSSNSVDVVGSYKELLAYDTKDINPNDIITVVKDEERQHTPTSYYRWTKSEKTGKMEWVFIAEEPPILEANEDTKGIATLGAPGGAARYEALGKVYYAILSGNGTPYTLTDAALSEPVLNDRIYVRPMDTAPGPVVNLRINNGTSRRVYASQGVDLPPGYMQARQLYELVFFSGAWHVVNIAPMATETTPGLAKLVTKELLGLANVNNTSDDNKPVSTAVATALAEKADKIDVRFHEHTNKAALDRLGVGAGLPTWNGGAWPGGGGNDGLQIVHIGQGDSAFEGGVTVVSGSPNPSTGEVDGVAINPSCDKFYIIHASSGLVNIECNREHLPQITWKIPAGETHAFIGLANSLDSPQDNYRQVPLAGGGGKDGITPHIGANGNWWVGTTDTGIKAAGTKGDKGDAATPPSITVSATTLPAGSQATVTKTGTDAAPHLAFGIPRGTDGDSGGGGDAFGSWRRASSPVEDPGGYFIDGTNNTIQIGRPPAGIYELLNASSTGGINYILFPYNNLIGPNGHTYYRIALFNGGAVRLYNQGGYFYTLAHNANVQFQSNGGASS